MLGIPSKIEEFGIEKLKNSRITDVSTLCGTYGMGGPGFFGLRLQGNTASAGLHTVYGPQVSISGTTIRDVELHSITSERSPEKTGRKVHRRKKILVKQAK